MAEPFNVEKFRQQMRGQVPEGQPVQMQAQPQAHMIPNPAAPQPYQPQPMPQMQGQPQTYQPQLAPQAVPQQQMPGPNMAPPAFAPPPNMVAEAASEVPKKSRFSLKRGSKVKKQKIKKGDKVQADEAGVVHKAKSPAMIFMFGMATGIICFLVGNMLMSTVLGDNPSKDFAEIERLNSQAQQPVLPKSAQNTDSAGETATP